MPYRSEMKHKYAITNFMHENAIVGFTQDTVLSILELMSQYHIRHIPILDENFDLYRIVTDTDLIILLGDKPTIETSRMTIADLPSKLVFTLDVSGTLLDAISLMTTHDVSCLPIVESEEIVGILTIKDILNADRLWYDIEDQEINPFQSSFGSSIANTPQISKNHSLWQILDILRNREHRDLLVVEKRDQIVGMVSSLPLIFEIIDYNRRVAHIKRKYSFEEFMFTTVLNEIMISSPIYLKTPVRINVIRRLMRRHGISAIILGTEEKPLKIITERDLFTLLTHEVKKLRIPQPKNPVN